jgi:hypothetical protein
MLSEVRGIAVALVAVIERVMEADCYGIFRA